MWLNLVLTVVSDKFLSTDSVFMSGTEFQTYDFLLTFYYFSYFDQ